MWTPQAIFQKHLYYGETGKHISEMVPRLVSGVVVSVSACHAVGRGFGPGRVIPKPS